MTCHNSTTKTCSKCNEDKALSEFSINKRMTTGRLNACKKCQNNFSKEYHHSKNGLTKNVYSNQRQNSKRRGDLMPSYTLIEFREWAFSHDLFHSLYKNWAASGYQKHLIPSADRMDDYKPYSFGNIQWMTWAENSLKGCNDIKNGVNNKQNKAVVQMNLNGAFVAEYHSIRHAARVTDSDDGHIAPCCLGNAQTHNGYIWLHAEDYLPTN